MRAVACYIKIGIAGINVKEVILVVFVLHYRQVEILHLRHSFTNIFAPIEINNIKGQSQPK
jgi:hypothetical protein